MSRKNILSFYTVLAVWLAIILSHWLNPFINPITWDAFGYYLYLPLTFIYHDLGLQHKEVIDHIFALYDPSNTFYQATHIPSGNWMMKYTMGMAILYSPGFFVAHFITAFTGYPADGFSLPYQIALAVNSVLFSMIGFWYLRKVLLYFFTDRITAVVLFLLFFGTNYFIYSLFSAETVHNYLFTFYALILWNTILWHRYHRKKNMIALALLIGLATLARPTELLSLVIPLLWNVTSFKGIKDKIRLISTTYKNQLVWFVIIMAAIGSLQIIYWKIYSGSFVYYSYVNPGEGFEFLSPYLWKVLFSFRKGWFIYTPMMLLAVTGFWFIYKNNRKLFYPLFIFFILNLYVVSSWSCWWYAQSFGQRALVQSYAVMAIPLGYFIRWMTGRKFYSRVLFAVVVLFFIWLNIFQTWQIQHHVISGDRMTFSYYIKSFGRTNINPEDEKLLLVQRLYADNKPVIKDESLYSKKVLKTIGFEKGNKSDSSHYTYRFAHSGDKSLMMDSTLRYAASYRIPFRELTDRYYAWIKVTVWVYPVHNLDETPSAIVITFQHNKKNYHYRAQAFNSLEIKNNLKLNRWNKVEMLYLTPEVRKKEDNLLVYLWNRGKKDIYFDDLKIEMMEPKDE